MEKTNEKSMEARSGDLMVVPLSRLVPSPHNVRKTNGTDVNELKASIKAQGVLQNLIVCPALSKRGKPTGHYEVVGGRRRLQALMALASEGEIEADEGIVCRVKPSRDAAEASLAENYHREPMHPADEFEAFHQLVQEGRSVEEVALRLGVSLLTVRRRLKLAHVHPTLVTLYREDEVTMEQLTALAVSDDQEEQLRVWETAPAWRRDAAFLHEALVAQEIDAARDPLARLVGLEAYEAAGGSVRRDLFSEEGTGYVQDTALLTWLATERLDAAAESVRAEGWSWVEVVPRITGGELYRFGRCDRAQRDLTKSEAKKLAALRQRVQHLAAKAMADEDGDDELEAQVDEAQEVLSDFENGLLTFTDEAYATGGALVCVDRSGRIEVHRGLVRPEDRTGSRMHTSAADSEEGTGGETEKQSVRPTHSAALMLELTAHRTLAARAALLDRPDVAMCALLHCLVQRLIVDGYGPTSSAVRLVPNAPEAGLIVKPGSDLGDARATRLVNAARERWGDRLPGDTQRLLPWLIGLDADARMDLLALCVALTLNDVRDTERSNPLEALCDALQLDMADWWEPTARGYFSRITKDAILSALVDGTGAEVAARIKGVSKGELARVAERELEGKRWLPSPLRSAIAEPNLIDVDSPPMQGDGAA